jgi:hypothetical protein
VTKDVIDRVKDVPKKDVAKKDVAKKDVVKKDVAKKDVTSPTGLIGTPCTKDADCKDGLCLDAISGATPRWDQGFKQAGGYCSKDCTCPNCSEAQRDKLCPEGSRCVVLDVKYPEGKKMIYWCMKRCYDAKNDRLDISQCASLDYQKRELTCEALGCSGDPPRCGVCAPRRR